MNSTSAIKGDEQLAARFLLVLLLNLAILHLVACRLAGSLAGCLSGWLAGWLAGLLGLKLASLESCKLAGRSLITDHEDLGWP